MGGALSDHILGGKLGLLPQARLGLQRRNGHISDYLRANHFGMVGLIDDDAGPNRWLATVLPSAPAIFDLLFYLGLRELKADLSLAVLAFVGNRLRHIKWLQVFRRVDVGLEVLALAGVDLDVSARLELLRANLDHLSSERLRRLGLFAALLLPLTLDSGARLPAKGASDVLLLFLCLRDDECCRLADEANLLGRNQLFAEA